MDKRINKLLKTSRVTLKTIQIFNVVFELEIEDDKVITCNFEIDKPIEHTEEDYRFAQQLVAQILEGKWDWLIAKDNKVITIPINDITVIQEHPIWHNRLTYKNVQVTTSNPCTCTVCQNLIDKIKQYAQDNDDILRPEILLNLNKERCQRI